MISKSEITYIRKLQQKKFREQERLFIVEGIKSVDDLLKSSLKTKAVYCTEHWLQEHSSLLQKKEYRIVTEDEMVRISCLITPQEVAAIVETPSYSLSSISSCEPILALDDIRDPGNMGTIIRTAEWFGFKHIVCSNGCVEFSNPKVIQATMGSFCRMQVYTTDLPTFLQSQKGRHIYGTFMEGTPITDIRFSRTDIIIIGNEANGISPSVAQAVNAKIHIPCDPHSRAESLNASIATAIVLFRMSTSL